jgi:hypothetical protein
LGRKGQLDADGFASAEDWMEATLTHRYPLAPERIARGHTQVTLNPATILISLSNDYVHADWWIKKGSDVVRFGGTHGALDDLNSVGMVLSSFAPTTETSTRRVAALFDGFSGLRDYRVEQPGVEWISGSEQALTRIRRGPPGCAGGTLADEEIFLRVWGPEFAHIGSQALLEVTVRKIPRFASAPMRRPERDSVCTSEQCLPLERPIPFTDNCAYERIYPLPAELKLEPQETYSISGRIREGRRNTRLFKFPFHTDGQGRPIAY